MSIDTTVQPKDFTHIQIGTRTDPHTLIVDADTTADQLTEAATIAEANGRPNTAQLLREVASVRAIAVMAHHTPS